MFYYTSKDTIIQYYLGLIPTLSRTDFYANLVASSLVPTPIRALART